jgi:hypothetical protein
MRVFNGFQRRLFTDAVQPVYRAFTCLQAEQAAAQQEGCHTEWFHGVCLLVVFYSMLTVHR